MYLTMFMPTARMALLQEVPAEAGQVDFLEVVYQEVCGIL